MYKVSRRCYEIFANSGVVKAPSSEYLRKITTAPYVPPASYEANATRKSPKRWSRGQSRLGLART